MADVNAAGSREGGRESPGDGRNESGDPFGSRLLLCSGRVRREAKRSEDDGKELRAIGGYEKSGR